MKDRANTVDQKFEVMKRLLTQWQLNPDLRLGQLIGNVFQSDIYFVEDHKLIDKLEAFYGETVQDSGKNRKK